jgi:hypothetical protein
VPRTIAEKVYDRARSKTLEDITTVYPELWQFLLDKRVTDYRDPEHTIYQRYDGDLTKTYDHARRDAKMDLKELRPGAWQLLLWGWSEHFKVELGYVDQRAQANQARDYSGNRGEGGRFART